MAEGNIAASATAWTRRDEPSRAVRESDAAPEGGSGAKRALTELDEQLQRAEEAITMLFHRLEHAVRPWDPKPAPEHGRLHQSPPSPITGDIEKAADRLAREVDRLHELRLQLDV